MNKNMATQEMLASLEAQIRKDIPRLMELREGCLVRKDNEVFRIEENPKGDGYYVGRYFYLYEESIAERYEIIGHDIMLNDVLEWLSYLGFLTECSNIDFGGDTFCRSELVYDDDGNFLYKKTTFCEWKLSSPYLKDQSEELIKFLYNLIKE